MHSKGIGRGTYPPTNYKPRNGKRGVGRDGYNYFLSHIGDQWDLSSFHGDKDLSFREPED